jgi:ornithine carbamoyltransferase
MRRFNDLADFSREEIKDLITLAERLDTKPEPRALEGKVLSLLFLSPSLRTLSSFQAAMIRLGGGAFVISPDMSIHGLESRSGKDLKKPLLIFPVCCMPGSFSKCVTFLDSCPPSQ